MRANASVEPQPGSPVAEVYVQLKHCEPILRWFDGPDLEVGTKLYTAPAWQPIETAPKDGTDVLLWSEDGIEHMRLHPKGSSHEYFNVNTGNFGHKLHECYTHWMPAPSPPNASLTGGEAVRLKR